MTTATDQFVLGVDLDGVCADFYPALRTVFAQWRGVPVESLADQFGPDLAEWGALPGEYEKVHRHAVIHQDLFRRLDVIENAPQVLRRLSDAGIRIRIITHRLYVAGTHLAAATQTIAWLEHHAIPYSDLCFMRDKAMVEANLYIDDGPHNIRTLQAAGRDVLAFSAPPNRAMTPAPAARVDTWLEAETKVMDRYRDWQSARTNTGTHAGTVSA